MIFANYFQEGGVFFLNFRDESYTNIYAAGIAIAIAPVEETPVPTRVPKTGHMSKHMGFSGSRKYSSRYFSKGKMTTFDMQERSTVCLMDTGKSGIYMSISPIFPPR